MYHKHSQCKIIDGKAAKFKKHKAERRKSRMALAADKTKNLLIDDEEDNKLLENFAKTLDNLNSFSINLKFKNQDFFVKDFEADSGRDAKMSTRAWFTNEYIRYGLPTRKDYTLQKTKISIKDMKFYQGPF